MFTYQYQQPDEYHFSLDSIHFVEFVAKHFTSSTHISLLRVLDLCAGCGVMGLELSWYIRELRQIDFVEIQDIYTEYFNKNVSRVNRSELALKWHLINYNQLVEKNWNNRFDLIISNPPYFQAGHGILSPSTFKNRCRFYLDSSFDTFIFAIVNSLDIGGKAYFLLRPLKHHGLDLFSQAQKLLQKNVSINIVHQIRGTDVVLIEKAP